MEPITAHDFVFSFQRIVDPKNDAPYAWYYELAGILNASAIIKGNKTVDSLGVKALSDKQLQIILEQPISYFLKMLTDRSMFAVPKNIVEKYKDQWTKPNNIVSNSAYKLAQFDLGKKIILERNKHYWNDSNTVIDKVTYSLIKRDIEEIEAFKAGKIDIAYDIPLSEYKHLKEEEPNQLFDVPMLGTYFYLFNVNKKPFDDPRVRKALAYSIDREALVQNTLEMGLPAYGVTPTVVDEYRPPNYAWTNKTQDQRNAEAKKLLNQAGYNENNPLSINLSFNTSETHKKIAIVIASMWMKSLDVMVETSSKDWPDYMDSLEKGDFSIARYAWVGDYNESSTFLSLFSNKGMNVTGWDNTQFNQFLDKGMHSKSLNERIQSYTKAGKIFADEMPAIPIYFYTSPILINEKVGGYSVTNPSSNRYSRDLYIKK